MRKIIFGSNIQMVQFHQKSSFIVTILVQLLLNAQAPLVVLY